jgi:putative transposase
MQTRKVVLATNEIYHVYNRSIAKEQICTTLTQLHHFLKIIDYYRFPQELRYSEFNKLSSEAKDNYLFLLQKKNPIVEIYAYAFMPNHYHFLLKQLEEDGIRQFISITQNSIAKYFNIRNDRHGGLFQSPFQARWIESDEQFMHVSRYIHLNPVTAFKITINQLSSYPYTSFPEYVGNSTMPWLNTQLLLKMFPSKNKYREFVENQVDYQRTLASISDLLMD